MTDATAPIKKVESLWSFNGLSARELFRDILREVRASDLSGHASELAFDFLFALFPLMLFMVTLFGFFASRSVELQSNLLSYFADFLPPVAFGLVRSTVIELATHASGGKLTSGLVIALWFASGGVSSMISGLNLACHVHESRSWIKVRLIAIGLTLLIAVLLLAALFLVLVSGRLVDWLGAILGLPPIAVALWKALQWPAAILFVLVSYSLIYRFGPDLKERRWNWITPGSAFGVFLWLLASIVFRGYLHFFNTYSTTYGSLGAMMILLVWLYVTGLAFLIGGFINAEIERAAVERSAT